MHEDDEQQRCPLDDEVGPPPAKKKAGPGRPRKNKKNRAPSSSSTTAASAAALTPDLVGSFMPVETTSAAGAEGEGREIADSTPPSLSWEQTKRIVGNDDGEDDGEDTAVVNAKLLRTATEAQLSPHEIELAWLTEASIGRGRRGKKNALCWQYVENHASSDLKRRIDRARRDSPKYFTSYQQINALVPTIQTRATFKRYREEIREALMQSTMAKAREEEQEEDKQQRQQQQQPGEGEMHRSNSPPPSAEESPAAVAGVAPPPLTRFLHTQSESYLTLHETELAWLLERSVLAGGHKKRVSWSYVEEHATTSLRNFIDEEKLRSPKAFETYQPLPALVRYGARPNFKRYREEVREALLSSTASASSATAREQEEKAARPPSLASESSDAHIPSTSSSSSAAEQKRSPETNCDDDDDHHRRRPRPSHRRRHREAPESMASTTSSSSTTATGNTATAASPNTVTRLRTPSESHLNDLEIEIAWLGERALVGKRSTHLIWSEIEANASKSLRTFLVRMRKQEPQLHFTGNQKKCLIRSDAYEPFRIYREEVRRVLAPAQQKEEEEEEPAGSDDDAGGEEREEEAGGDIGPPTLSQAESLLNDYEIEIVWLGERSLCSSSKRGYDWGYIEENASDDLRSFIRKMKREKRARFESGNAINALVRWSAKEPFYQYRSEVRSLLTLGSSGAAAAAATSTRGREMHHKKRKRTSPAAAVSSPHNLSSSSPAAHRSNATVVMSEPLPPAKLEQLRRRMKQTHEPGDRVFACWFKNHEWYPATVRSCETYDGSGQYGASRRYSVLFDDGDKDPDLEDIFVMSRADYPLSLRLESNGLLGIRHFTVFNSADDWSEIRGWYETDYTGDLVFGSLVDAVRAYDDGRVRELSRRGKEVTPSDLNLPEEWEFRRREEAPVRLVGSSKPDNAEEEEEYATFPTSSVPTSMIDDSPFAGTSSVRPPLVDVDDLIRNLRNEHRRYKREVEEHEICRQARWEAYAADQRARWNAYVREEERRSEKHLKRCAAYIARIEEIGRRIEVEGHSLRDPREE